MLTLFTNTEANAQTGTLTYPLKENVDLRDGTIECWVQFDSTSASTCPQRTPRHSQACSVFRARRERWRRVISLASIFGEKNGGWYFRPGPQADAAPVSVAAIWKKGEWHHVAVTWKRKLMIAYIDGKEAARRDQQATLQKMFGSVTDQQLMFGDQWHVAARFVIDDVRISTIARVPEELGFAMGEL
jgi:hypothetical protein